jgi:hypothetical protein
MPINDRVMTIQRRPKKLAREYRALTGEVAACEAACLLGLHLAPARQARFDANDALLT